MICAGWRTFTPHKGNDDGITYLVGFMVRHPRGSYIALPLLSLEVVIPDVKVTH